MLVSSLLTACGPKIYLANVSAYAPKHKVVAVLPAAVTMELRPNQAKRTSAEQQRDVEFKTGLDFQERIYSWLLRRSQQQHGFTVQFQDIMQTNAKLRESGIPFEELRAHSPQELAQILGVDAVLTTNVRTTKPMSDGAAIAVGVLVGAWGATNQANITVNIHETQEGKLLWKYDYLAAGSVGSSTENMVNALMRNASKKFPYAPKS